MKKVLKVFLLLFLLLGCTKVTAKTPELCDRNELPNYGVRKKWKITDANRYNVLEAPCVNAEDKIYDFSGVLTDEEYERLQTRIKEYIQKTNMDLVIVIADIPYVSDSRNEEYAADFYDYNDFGIDFNKYSGTLLLRNTYAEDPYYDIYTFGDAQVYYDYDRLQDILDGIYHDLHFQNYESGFNKYIDYLDHYYDKGIGLTGYTVDENGYLHRQYVWPGGVILLIATIVTFVIMMILVKKNKMIMKATQAKDYFDESASKVTNVADNFVSTHTSSYVVSSSSGGSSGGHSGGGHSSHSGSSGGGHSSGGGRHG